MMGGLQRLRVRSSGRRAGSRRRCGLAATLQGSQQPPHRRGQVGVLAPFLYSAASSIIVSAEELGKRTTTVIVSQIRAREVTFVSIYKITTVPSSLHARVTLVHDGNGPRHPPRLATASPWRVGAVRRGENGARPGATNTTARQGGARGYLEERCSEPRAPPCSASP